jgi:hypothetical protein
MWGWPRPRCPLGTWEKTWIEFRMCWLAERVGLERLITAEVLLPSADHFPEVYNATEDDARGIMHRLAGRMGLDPSKLILKVCEDQQMGSAAGLYDPSDPERPAILIAASQLRDPQRLIATLAHELSHDLLMGRGLISREAEDFEWVTDLTPVFFGLGMFAANTTVSESREDYLNFHRCYVRKHGYLPSHMFGYAFALFAFMRGETAPQWARFLRPDASGPFDAALRYLRRGGENLFHPSTIRAKRQPLTTDEAARRLRQGSASSRVAVLLAMIDERLKDPALIPEIKQLLADRDGLVVAQAARVLSTYGAEASSAVPELVRALSAKDNAAKEWAASALGSIAAEPELVVPALAQLLDGPSSELVATAAAALSAYGPQAAMATERLLAALRLELLDGGGPAAEEIAMALRAASAEPARLVRGFFTKDERELRLLAVALVCAASDGGAESLAESPTR